MRFAWACAELARKKPALAEACEAARGGCAEGVPRLVRFAEGPCIQIMHRGSYDDESETIAKLIAYMRDEKLTCDIAEGGESPRGARGRPCLRRCCGAGCARRESSAPCRVCGCIMRST